MLRDSTGHLPPAGSRDDLKKVAVEAARRGGAIVQEKARQGFRVEHKDVVNLVTDADRLAEQAIVDTIRSAYPDHRILSEECGQHVAGTSLFQWVIDPLDGTTNFAHGFPSYCVSIGLEYHGRCILGVVFDPTRQELFVAEIHRGAVLNGVPLHVSSAASLNAALLVTGFAYDIRESPNNNLNHFSRFALRAQGLRRTGAAALDLCYVAAGRFDGFWELKLQAWDMAAGVVIVQEAGGRVSDFSGGPFSIYGKELVASNGRLHDEMLAVLRQG